MKRLLTISLLLMALMLSPLGGPTLTRAAQVESGCPAYYTVKVGDNLFRISLKYGLSWTTVAIANGLPNASAIWVGQVLCIPAVLPEVIVPPVTPVTPAPAGSGGGDSPTPTPKPVVFTGIPTFSITGVVKDTTVTISTTNFPANTTFDVLMGAYGTLGIGGTKVGTQASGTGAFTATYTIPANLKGAAQIAIRLQSTSGYYSFNWFFNNTK